MISDGVRSDNQVVRGGTPRRSGEKVRKRQVEGGRGKDGAGKVGERPWKLYREGRRTHSKVDGGPAVA